MECTYCRTFGGLLPLSNFYSWSVNGKEYRDPTCKQCRSMRSKKLYRVRKRARQKALAIHKERAAQSTRQKVVA